MKPYATITETHTGKKFTLPYLAKSGCPRVCTTGCGIKVFRNGLEISLKWNEHGEKRSDGTLEPAGFDLFQIGWKEGGKHRRLATWCSVDGRPDSPAAEFRIESADGERRIGVIVFRRAGE